MDLHATDYATSTATATRYPTGLGSVSATAADSIFVDQRQLLLVSVQFVGTTAGTNTATIMDHDGNTIHLLGVSGTVVAPTWTPNLVLTNGLSVSLSGAGRATLSFRALHSGKDAQVIQYSGGKARGIDE